LESFEGAESKEVNINKVETLTSRVIEESKDVSYWNMRRNSSSIP
jgi:hypothetical protein